jgi:hypothetical protein
MKIIASMMIAGASAQFFPTGFGSSYGMSQGFGYGRGYGAYEGYGGYGGYGDLGRECRRGVVSDDLNGYASCYCDKNHRDEDPCELLVSLGGSIIGLGFDEKECRRGLGGYDGGYGTLLDFEDYYEDVFDEDCVQRANPPARTRRCPPKLFTQDLPSTSACWCDSSHKQDAEDVEDQVNDCLVTFIGDPSIALYASPFADEENLVSYHYSLGASGSKLASSLWSSFSFSCQEPLSTSCRNLKSCLDDVEEEFDKFDPNCIERFGGYGGNDAYGWGIGGGFGGFSNWGNIWAQPAATEGATTITTPQWNNWGGNQFQQWGYPTAFNQQWGR